MTIHELIIPAVVASLIASDPKAEQVKLSQVLNSKYRSQVHHNP